MGGSDGPKNATCWQCKFIYWTCSFLLVKLIDFEIEANKNFCIFIPLHFSALMLIVWPLRLIELSIWEVKFKFWNFSSWHLSWVAVNVFPLSFVTFCKNISVLISHMKYLLFAKYLALLSELFLLLKLKNKQSNTFLANIKKSIFQ